MFNNLSYSLRTGMAKGGVFLKPPLESKIFETPPPRKILKYPPLKSSAKRRLRTGFNHD